MDRLDRAERDARLLGTDGISGGITLPEVFRDVLETLLDESPLHEGELGRVIRKSKGFKEARVLEVWESWGNFSRAILSVLQDGGWITEAGHYWSITSRGIAQEGQQFVVLQDRGRHASRIRVTFHGTRARLAKEALGEAREKVEDLFYHLDSQKHLDPALRQARDDLMVISENLQTALRNPPPVVIKQEEKQAPPQEKGTPGHPTKDGSPTKNGQTEWYKNHWIKLAQRGDIEWFSQHDVRRAWNMQFPDKYLSSWAASSFRHVTRMLVDEGKLEQRKGKGEDGRHNAKEYRWIQGALP